MKYVMQLAYDGTAYHGWQMQTHCASISGTLHDAFYTAFKTDVQLLGASRTDAGVHALGQIVMATTDLDIPADKIIGAWNGRLPADIHIRHLACAADNFHPLANVLQKTYYYHFFTQRPLPFVQRFGATVYNTIDIQKLEKGLQIFVGTHDFRSFCTGDEHDSTIRTIDSIDVMYLRTFKTFRIIVRGKSFLRYMIRRIVGAAIDCATRPSMPIAVLQSALEARDPQQQLPKAEAKGLLLRKIYYSPPIW